MDFTRFKKGGAAALAESDSEESGYVDCTYGDVTMHASSFALDEPSQFWHGNSSEAHTPLTYIESDDESTASYISGVFEPVDPSALRDGGTQTPGHARTQTADLPEPPREVMTQTAELPRAVGINTSTTSIAFLQVWK